MAQPVKLNFSAPRRGLPPKHFADLTEDERIDKLAEIGLPKFRAKQLAKHYYEHYTDNVEDMTDIPAGKREAVKEAFFPELMKPIRTTSTDDGETTKSLWRLHDGTLLESVLMRYPGRATLCISSQAGCGMACPFCATGQGGLDRNLSTGEIVEQFRHAAAAMAAEGGRLSNVVFMGMGEPLANYKRVVQAVRQISGQDGTGFGLSQRNVTVSTVGLAPAIRKLADEDLACTLAVSLHTPDDELRDGLVPVNNRWSVQEVLDAEVCRASSWAAQDVFADKVGDGEVLVSRKRMAGCHRDCSGDGDQVGVGDVRTLRRGQEPTVGRVVRVRVRRRRSQTPPRRRRTSGQ